MSKSFGTTKQTEKLVQKWYKEEGNLRKMAEILLVDCMASMQENEESDTILRKVEPVNLSGCDLLDTVPAMLKMHGVTLESGIVNLLPEMARVVKAVDAAWGGKLTMAELADEFGDRMYTSLAMQFAGHGVSPEDEPGVSEMLAERGCEIPDGIYVDTGLVDDSEWLVEDDLRAALGIAAE